MQQTTANSQKVVSKRVKIGWRELQALPPGGRLWDSKVPGLGARRRKGDSVSFFVKTRTKQGRQVFVTLGKASQALTPDMARTRAAELLGEIAKGNNPAKVRASKMTVGELCDTYLAAVRSGDLLKRDGKTKKESTLATDAGRIERHIKPLLGSIKVAAVTSDDIAAFLKAVAAGKTAGRTKTAKRRGLAHVRGGKGTATRTVALLGGIFTYAKQQKLLTENPVAGVRKYAYQKRERRLSEAEYPALGEALRQAEAKSLWPAAIAATRFLALTGWRSGEALALRWKDIDLARRTATLPDSKTGKSMRPLSHAACDVVLTMTRTDGDALVFPASRGDGVMTGYRKLWNRIMSLKALPSDVTPHVLRHSFSSLANDLGYNEPTIAAMVGHRSGTTTSRYIHSADAVLLAAADAVADRTADLLGEPRNGGTVVTFPGAANA